MPISMPTVPPIKTDAAVFIASFAEEEVEGMEEVEEVPESVEVVAEENGAKVRVMLAVTDSLH